MQLLEINPSPYARIRRRAMAASNRYCPSVRSSGCRSRGSWFIDEESFQLRSQVRREGLHRPEISCTRGVRVCHRKIPVPAEHLHGQEQTSLYIVAKLDKTIIHKNSQNFVYVCYFPFLNEYFLDIDKTF